MPPHGVPGHEPPGSGEGAPGGRPARVGQKNGFRPVGSFIEPDGLRALDMILDLAP
ncbi:hypothetical protein ACFWUZ_12325 [Streptomyces sp. NPDC058646]|uniref:hypothetical protein n=1 Tax=Streptomyces sp. NPDC058646 TaxID=3346574 RepID=UPI0036687170